MNTKKHIAELHPEVKAWMSYVNYVKDELKVHNLRLEEIIQKNSGKEVMAHIEHFQNQFIRQNEACDELMHDLHAAEKTYSDIAIGNGSAMHILVADEATPIPVDHPRGDFVHWVMADIPADVRELAAGACSDGVTATGKRAPNGPMGARHGINDYTGWFAGDAQMGGDYLGYDGPYPPAHDLRLHRSLPRVRARCVEAGLARAIRGCGCVSRHARPCVGRGRDIRQRQPASRCSRLSADADPSAAMTPAAIKHAASKPAASKRAGFDGSPRREVAQ